jgi:uncharacterized membrane protein HdeD (DUF308 family)
MSVIHSIAALAVIAFGLYSVAQPRASAGLAHLNAEDATGIAETRITFGALPIGLGLAPLLLNQAVVYQVVGIVWLCAGIMRVIAALIDRPQLTSVYIISGVFEWVMALIFLL